jgi:diguanylate cyclase (GGDEF)-like protein/PAS domain S-box-containing protein
MSFKNLGLARRQFDAWDAGLRRGHEAAHPQTAGGSAKPQHRWTIALAILTLAALPVLLLFPVVPVAGLRDFYPAFHVAAELAAIITAVLIFNVGHYGMAEERPVANYILACTFLAVALLDLLHTLSYSGMPNFVTTNTPHKAIVLWLGARYIEAVGLVAWLLWPDRLAVRPARSVVLALALAWVAVMGVVGVVTPEVLPATFVAGSGPTAVKIALEWGVMGLLAVAIVAAVAVRQRHANWRTIVTILMLMVGSELCFTLYVQPDDATNAIGHVYKLAAFYLLYRIAVVQAIHRPVRALAAARIGLVEREAHLRQILDGAPEGVIGVDSDGVIRFLNPMVVTLFGYAPTEIVGQPVEMLVPERMRALHSARRERYRQYPWPRPMGMLNQLIGRRADGSEFPVEVSLQPATDPGGLDVAFVRDVTDKRRQEEELRWRANYDELTGLPNRRLLNDRLGHALAGSRRSRNYGALLFLDLDNFKNLNDTRGHYVGDRLLTETAHRIQANVRGGDSVARLGGDEFVVILEDLSLDLQEAAVQARLVGEKIRESLNLPFLLDGGEFHCAASLGVAMFRSDEESVESLLKHADLAMYKAKGAGRNTLRFFDPTMQVTLDERSALEADLRLAIEARQLHLQFQPQVDRDGRFIGAEALLRWTHPQRGMVPPDDFIPLAEETGLILPIGHWVMMAACEQIAAWSENPATRALRLAVNVSARQFRQPDFVADVRHVLARTGADPARLKIELTESMVLDDIGDTFEKMHTLKALGIGFSLDDFGTGNSSLSYLTRLPLDQLKIDRSFVLNLPDNRNDAIIAQTIITMARSLGLDVIAEGVETEAQREFLDCHDCTAYQGYLFSRPLLPADFNALLMKFRAAAAI